MNTYTLIVDLIDENGKQMTGKIGKYTKTFRSPSNRKAKDELRKTALELVKLDGVNRAEYKIFREEEDEPITTGSFTKVSLEEGM
jgi:hypothetical protein